ncbi:MAG: O-methyltransferase [Chloroflexota bacterium]
MSDEVPRPVADHEMERYATAHSTAPSDALAAVARSTRAWSTASRMMVDEVEVKLLALLVAISGARRVLEVGTFSGYSAISMAEALPREGQLTTLEFDPAHVAKAREHIEASGVSDKITIIQGPALDSLGTLEGPFDLAFIDADKAGYPDYFSAIVPLLSSGGLIVADNVLREGRVLDATSGDPDIVGMRLFNDMVVADQRVEAVMLTVRDGITLIRRRA